MRCTELVEEQTCRLARVGGGLLAYERELAGCYVSYFLNLLLILRVLRVLRGFYNNCNLIYPCCDAESAGKNIMQTCQGVLGGVY